MDDVSLDDIKAYVGRFEEEAYKGIADRYAHFLFIENEQLRALLADRDEKIIQLIKTKELNIVEGIKRGLSNGREDKGFFRDRTAGTDGTSTSTSVRG